MKCFLTTLCLSALVFGAGCSSFLYEKSEYSDEEARVAEAAELEFFAKRQLPEGDFPGTSSILSTALAMRCFLEADVMVENSQYGKTVESGLGLLIRWMERGEPIAREDEAVDLRVAVWTLVLAYGETKNPNVLSAIREGVARLDRWNARTHFSMTHTKFDEYQRMGMESLILLEMRRAGIGCRGCLWAERLEGAVRRVDRQEWCNHIGAIRLAFSVHNIDPYENVRDRTITCMRMCGIPPREMSLDHYRVLERLYQAYEPHPRGPKGMPEEFMRVQRESEMASLRTDRARAINGLRKLDRSGDDAIREAALFVLGMPRPRWGRYFWRPSPKPEVELSHPSRPSNANKGDDSKGHDVNVEVGL